jgi:hypothetical protein
VGGAYANDADSDSDETGSRLSRPAESVKTNKRKLLKPIAVARGLEQLRQQRAALYSARRSSQQSSDSPSEGQIVLPAVGRSSCGLRPAPLDVDKEGISSGPIRKRSRLSEKVVDSEVRKDSMERLYNN